MIVKILGIQPVNFTSSDGSAVHGTNLFCAFEDENTTGLKTEKFFIKDGVVLPKDTSINDTVDLVFNFKGKVEKINKAG